MGLDDILVGCTSAAIGGVVGFVSGYATARYDRLAFSHSWSKVAIVDTCESIVTILAANAAAIAIQPPASVPLVLGAIAGSAVARVIAKDVWCRRNETIDFLLPEHRSTYEELKRKTRKGIISKDREGLKRLTCEEITPFAMSVLVRYGACRGYFVRRELAEDMEQYGKLYFGIEEMVKGDAGFIVHYGKWTETSEGRIHFLWNDRVESCYARVDSASGALAVSNANRRTWSKDIEALTDDVFHDTHIVVLARGSDREAAMSTALSAYQKIAIEAAKRLGK